MSLEFLNKIYGESVGLISIVTNGPDGKPNSERWFEWPGEREYVERYVGFRLSEDLFASTSLFSTKKRTNGDDQAIAQAVGVDADTCHPDNFRVPPNIRVQTGEDRWHCWWLLDAPVPAAEAALIAKRIATAHESQGCDKPHTHHVSKILRVPESTNTKHEQDGLMWTVEVFYDEDAPIYSPEMFDDVYGDIAVGALATRAETFTAEDFDQSIFTDDELERLRLYAQTAWDEDLRALETGMVPGSWHTTGYRIACNMFRNANVKWSPWTQKDVIAEVTRLGKPDSPSSERELGRMLTDAMKEVGSDSLSMPSWALELMPDRPPEAVRGAAYRELEGKVKALGMDVDFVRGMRDGETSTSRTLAMSRSLFSAGLSAREVFSLMVKATANSNKNKRAATAVWADVQLAADTFQTMDDSVEDVANISFLSDEERQYLLDEPSFVDRYVDWVKSRTDAAVTYSQALSWMALSAVYSDKGYMPLAWNPHTPLNLWTLILGDTTLTRKSTAKNFYLRLIRTYESMTGEKVDIGSNSTAEAIVQELGKRDGLTSLLHTDEVNGFFRTMYTKNYAAGTMETFTELYDGDVQVSLRATQGSGNKNRAKTQFLFLGVGIRKETAEILTKKNFESGFLARMLWSVADTPATAKAPDAVQFAEGRVSRDEVLDALVDELMVGAVRYSSEDRVAVTSDKAALDRVNLWARSASAIAAKVGDPEVLSPSLARMSISVQKAASLLALHEGTTTVTLRHMLFALRQAESWFKDMIRMAGEVSSSEYERRLVDVENYIGKAGDEGRTDQQIRKQFTRFRPQEVDEIFRALGSQGRIRKHPDDPKKWVVIQL